MLLMAKLSIQLRARTHGLANALKLRWQIGQFAYHCALETC